MVPVSDFPECKVKFFFSNQPIFFMKISGYRQIPAAVANDTDRHKSLEEDGAEPFFQKADILFCR